MISLDPVLKNLANIDWQNNAVPSLGPLQKSDLAKLKDIAKHVKQAFATHQDREAAAKVARKCWEFATHIPDPHLSLLACRICQENLPEDGENREDKANRQPVHINIGGEVIKIPGYYKILLANASPYFKTLFEGVFREKQSGIFAIEEVSPIQFTTLITLFEADTPLKEIELKDFVELLKVADRLELKSIQPFLIKELSEVIMSFEPSPANSEIVQTIYACLKDTSFFGNLQLLQAIDEYYRKATSHLKSFEDWAAFTQKLGINLLSIDLSDLMNALTDDRTEQLLANCPNLTSLKIRAAKITDESLNTIAKLKNLASLDLAECALLTNKNFHSLKELKSLTRLNLNRCFRLTSKCLESLKGLKNLTSFSFVGCDLESDQDFEFIKELKSLTSLNLSHCDKLTDKHLETIKNLKYLTSLNLSDCTKLTDKGLESIKELKSLNSLNLSLCHNLTDQALKALIELRSLTSLNLNCCNLLTDSGLEYIKDIKSLLTLKLGGWDLLTDKGLENIKDLKNLSSLHLGYNRQLTNKSLELLKGLKNLKLLDLSNCERLTDKGLENIKDLKMITHLDLGFCHLLTDEGLKSLRRLTNLTFLNLQNCKLLTNKGLKSLKKLKSLRILRIQGCDQVTQDAIRSLKALNPALRIIR